MNIDKVVKRVMESGLAFQISGVGGKFYFVKITTSKSQKWVRVEITCNFLYMSSGIDADENKRTEYSSEEKLLEFLEHAIKWLDAPQEPEAVVPKKKKK